MHGAAVWFWDIWYKVCAREMAWEISPCLVRTTYRVVSPEISAFEQPAGFPKTFHTCLDFIKWPKKRKTKKQWTSGYIGLPCLSSSQTADCFEAFIHLNRNLPSSNRTPQTFLFAQARHRSQTLRRERARSNTRTWVPFGQPCGWRQSTTLPLRCNSSRWKEDICQC